jgi:probable phosphoglycerate mutase
MTTSLFLMRHGRPRGDGAKRFLGQTDVPLDKHGRRQAGWWCECLRRIPFSRIVSSDLARARESAEIIAGNANRRRVEPLAALREIRLGDWENRTFEEIRQAYPAQWQARGRDPEGFRPAGGESFGDLRRRVTPVVYAMLAADSGPLLVVAHAGVNRVILCDILGISLRRMFLLAQDHGCLNLIQAQPTGPRVKTLNLAPDLLAQLAIADCENVTY